MTLEKRTYPFVICFIEQLVPSNNKKTVEQEINMLFHEMKKKLATWEGQEVEDAGHICRLS